MRAVLQLVNATMPALIGRALHKRSFMQFFSYAFSMRLFLFLFSIFLLNNVTVAAEFGGKVVSVADGDTLTVLVNNRQIRIRLVEIDAPEKGQAYGTRSRQSLSDMTHGKIVRVVSSGPDRFKRELGRVYAGGLDVNAEQVRRGMAWVFDRYVTDRSLYVLQDDAKAARRGLWAEASSLPPWEWRRIKRDKAGK